MAKKYTITNEYDALKITRKWWTPTAYFFVFFSLFWNAIVLVFLFSGAGIFILIHLLVGLGIGWYTLATIFNKTVIEAGRQELSITHGPVPWPLKKERRIDVPSLTQLYVEKSSVRINNQTTYNLIAKLDTGAKIKLMTSHLDRGMLLDLERAIEAHLNIENDPNAGYQEAKFDQLDLEQFNEQMEKLEPIMNWLPKGMVENIKQKQAEMKRRYGGDGGAAQPHEFPNLPPQRKRGATSPRPPRHAGGKELYIPANPINFPLYASEVGTEVNWKNQTWAVTRIAQIDFKDDDVTTGRIIELQTKDGGESTYLYAQEDHNRWTYAEERRLDDDEVTTLGFMESTVAAYPMKLENGDDRYYPRSEQTGTRYTGGAAVPIKQYVYFTVGAPTQFRALRPEGRPWEVYVQEVMDAGDFEAAT